jgi:hypothetical protein
MHVFSPLRIASMQYQYLNDVGGDLRSAWTKANKQLVKQHAKKKTEGECPTVAKCTIRISESFPKWQRDILDLIRTHCKAAQDEGNMAPPSVRDFTPAIAALHAYSGEDKNLKKAAKKLQKTCMAFASQTVRELAEKKGTHMHVCMHVCMCVCVCVCMHVCRRGHYQCIHAPIR